MRPLSACVTISALWLVWCGLLPGLFAIGTIGGDPTWYRSYGWTSSIVLSAVAWINWGIHRKDRFARFAVLVAVGMTLGMAADFYGNCLAGRFNFHALYVTVPLFALGHVGYIWGTLDLAGKLRLSRRANWHRALFVTAAVYCLIGAVLWGVVVYRSDDLPELHLPTLAYTVFLSLAAGVMTAVARFDRHFLAMGIGGALFLASDVFLAIGIFQHNWHRLGDYCWITYGIGQMLIVYGAIGGIWKRESGQDRFESAIPGSQGNS